MGCRPRRVLAVDLVGVHPHVPEPQSRLRPRLLCPCCAGNVLAMTTPAGFSPVWSDRETVRTVDVVVVGTGPGGEYLTSELAGAGLSVVAIEKHLVGGECPFYGCIPSKMMLRAAETLAEARRARAIAGDVTVRPVWSRVAKRISSEATHEWSDVSSTERLRQAGATVVHGHGRLAGPHQVAVERSDGGTARFVARSGVVLNPGTRPAMPAIDGLEATPYWTNRDAVRTATRPRSLIVLGGGPTAVELAQAFARFGTEVTIVERGDRLLRREEPTASEVLREALEHDGIGVLVGADTARVDYDGGFTLRLREGAPLHAERLLLAAGRTPNLDDIGLETVGLASAATPVSENLRIGDRLWLIGDVVGQGAFTHVSMHHAQIVARQLLNRPGPRTTTPVVPRVTFTDPEVASVGLTEAQARTAGRAVASGRADLGSRGLTHGPGAEAGFVKLVADVERQVLVGATAVGPYAGEVLSMLTLAVHAQVPISTLKTMIFAYPTFHRAVLAALGELR
jgi:pyruvate/2-oxoglutarate dehydrogenase complex dihydrolipoamide dehydrogenase (E3) component